MKHFFPALVILLASPSHGFGGRPQYLPVKGQPCEIGHRDQVAAQIEKRYGKVFDAVWAANYGFYVITLDKGSAPLTVKMDQSFAHIISVEPWPKNSPSLKGEVTTVKTCLNVPPYAWRDVKPGGYVVTTGPGAKRVKPARSEAAAPSGEQFDLLCAMSWQDREIWADKGYPESKWSNTNERFRIDLRTRHYCSGDCTEISALQSVTPSELVLHRSSNPSGGYSKINRLNGAIEIYMHAVVPGLESSRRGTGTCQKATFTPFPTARF
jgi:hypothetical protein